MVPNAPQKARLVAAARLVLEARAKHPGATLAELYDPAAMPGDLRTSHSTVDATVDGLYGLTRPTEAQRMKVLMRRYAELTGQS